MKKRGDEKTIFAIKIRGGSTAREVWQLVQILAAFGVLFATLGWAQVHYCRERSPRMTWRECLRPEAFKRILD